MQHIPLELSVWASFSARPSNFAGLCGDATARDVGYSRPMPEGIENPRQATHFDRKQAFRMEGRCGDFEAEGMPVAQSATIGPSAIFV
jgi:hypothetical protein